MSRSASSRRNTSSDLKAMSESIQNRWVKDSSDRNLIRITLRPRVIRLSLWRWRMQGSPTCLEREAENARDVIHGDPGDVAGGREHDVHRVELAEGKHCVVLGSVLRDRGSGISN